MRIEELVIDGFKSYPVRTRITGWDASFNAITGLNGSGKSNILDAICFVLGITNMSTMRAQNQTDLIYKRGTAGVTKASVTIVFNNEDRSKSPVGLEGSPTITVTRQVALPNVSKYLLNGHKTTQQNIQNIFQSVQLNINNPNFVIMQGKITKVLNMKAPEILSLVEEAAGTRMFEDRKEKAKRNMDKKQRKVDELIATLDEEVKPKLDKRRKQRDEWLQYTKANTELEKLGQLLHAYEWTEATHRLEAKEQEVEEKKEQIDAHKRDVKTLHNECKQLEKDADKVEKKRDAEMKKGGRLAQLKEEVGEGAKEARKMGAQVDLKKKDVEDEQERIQSLEVELQEHGKSLDAKLKEIKTLDDSSQEINKSHAELASKLAQDEALLQTLLTGVTDSKAKNAGGGGGYLGALQAAQKRDTDGASEAQAAKNNLVMSEKELKDLETKFKAVKKDADSNKAKVDQMQRDVDDLQKKVEATGWSTEKEEQLNATMRDSRAKMQKLSDQRDRLRHELGKAHFQYQPPSNFDTRKVKGSAASLIHLGQEHYDKATALELAAGGRLYHVVVEDDHASSRILKECNLRQRVTLIPLNKINAHGISKEKWEQCKRVAPGNNAPALELVQSTPDVAKAMEYVFSDTVICENSAAANKVTFGAGIRSVTVQGDVYDVGGTLSGGAAPTTSGILLKVQDVLRAEAELQEARHAGSAAENELNKNKARREKWKALSQELEMKIHQLHLLEQQVGGSSASRLEADVDALKERIAALQQAYKDAERKRADAQAEVKKLKKDMEEFKNNKEGKIDELRSAINKQKSALQKHQVQVTTRKKETQTATLEKEQIERDIENTKERIEAAHKNVKNLQKACQKLAEEYETKQAQQNEIEGQLKAEEAALGRFDEELQSIRDAITDKKGITATKEMEIQQIEHALGQVDKEKKSLQNRIALLEEQHSWIENDCHEFGKPGGKYDFSGQNLPQMRERVAALEQSQAGKKKKVNPRVMAELESLEKQDKKLNDQLNQVLRDKEKIESTIAELDGYKRDALTKTWEKVDGDFGGIFGELLPGNFAKLEPPEGGDLMDGLEVKVRLGSVWKQSLTELSGGQRSLIALSLIMALLQFKPAPMYILDEIDAALDLSHTQHIGHLFRTRFKGSQFIVVSLKEGLFTNANVLFRARFRDGTSIVERTASRSSSTVYNS